MPLDMPWAIGGGAENSVGGARRALYDSTQGARGVTHAGDMKVSQTPTPGSSVRIKAGTCKSPNDYQSQPSESYSGAELGVTDFPCPATGSSGGATRYLVWRVDDPQFGGQVPGDVANGPYCRYQWLSSDPVKNPPAYPHVPLAKVVQPANTATITNSMITDLREVAVPRTKTVEYPYAMTLANGTTYLADKKTGGEWFPGGELGQQYSNITVPVPEWATQMVVEAQWLSVGCTGASSWGSCWVEYGDQYKAAGWTDKRDYEFQTQAFGWDVQEDASGKTYAYRTNWLLADVRTIPAKFRGKDIKMLMKAIVNGSKNAQAKKVYMDSNSGIFLRVTFRELATAYSAGEAA
ncbi:hypothetical protein NQ036_06775 [Brevibacterium sp. 91QC2O2]|uniref:hypothetical protein n=1 Tax=Brevibacterium sp. 91QC2O2 TaxID=2968458 RepID=UPI00211C9010|nr:hypothetical protein [Brevibacterium sp. 91QC2O2]MCQ9367947.1 hypothetical protein [Brevibacterium sp. 91QC2O2]